MKEKERKTLNKEKRKPERTTFNKRKKKEKH